VDGLPAGATGAPPAGGVFKLHVFVVDMVPFWSLCSPELPLQYRTALTTREPAGIVTVARLELTVAAF
jgi:hypothetical protein